MARTPRAGDLLQQTHRMEEEIRQLRLRRLQSSTAAIATFSDITDDDLYNRSSPSFEGWQINSPVTFSKQGNAVYVYGSVQWVGASGGYEFLRSQILRADVLPEDFQPNGSRRILTTSAGTASPENLWQLFLLDTGIIQTSTFHIGTPAAPWGSLADFAAPVVNLEFSYAVVI